MANKAKRQPKAGELAGRGSPRFAKITRETPADNFAPAMRPARPERNRENTDISLWRHKITFCDARVAYGAETWRVRGGMIVGAGSSGSTSGTVPQAFAKHA